MAVRFFTDSAQSLLDAFDARIEQEEQQGKINTWEKSSDGKYYTHTSAQWAKLAWFKPRVCDDRLLFNIIKPQNKNISTVVYGYYHGHLIETFLNHFDDQFSTGVATARPTSDDKVQS
ncbi:MAG: hypothetical protein E7K72_21020 [Roseomonas mucosa]|nr:hypothetical protein [Roseomonas mucosa]